MKKFLIVALSLILLLTLGIITWYLVSLGPVKKDSEVVSFNIPSGTSTQEVVTDLYDAGLIKSKLASLIYLKMHKIVIQASSYELNKNMNTEEIFNELKHGNKNSNTIRITFVEGMRLDEYLKLIADNFDWQVADIKAKINDQEYLKSLVKDYWFLDDNILNSKLYYGLEGYLFPDTYEFYKTSSFEDVIAKMLNQMGKNLESIKKEISNDKYNFHEILTMASIVEKEAVNNSDREKVAQVIYKRLDLNMNLGMDVTAYYGVGKDLKESLTTADLDNNNPYNTRLNSLIGLPVGPICSPSLESIKAVLNPAATNYIYFYADTKTGEVHFTEDYNEFLTFKEIYG